MKQLTENERMQIVLIALCLVILSISLMRLQILQSYSTTGADLQAINDQIMFYQKENLALEDTYLIEASYNTLMQKAQQAGFTENTKYINL